MFALLFVRQGWVVVKSTGFAVRDYYYQYYSCLLFECPDEYITPLGTQFHDL